MFSRQETKPVPEFDLIKHNALKDESKFWIGYANKEAKVLLPEFVTEAIVTEECKTKIFPQKWIDYVKKHSTNQKLQLTQEIKTNIDKYARDLCYHPSDQIAYVRYAFSNTQKTCLARKNYGESC